MVEASCHCGAVRLETETAPSEVTNCNCSVCRRYGVLWAYYSPHQVHAIEPTGATDIYTWSDRNLEFHRCRSCGCLTHWAARDRARNRMGVNARLMDPEVLARARLRHLDGADTWTYRDDRD